ncbi:MAG: DUF6521 family protein [Candidatus Marithrix sp.]
MKINYYNNLGIGIISIGFVLKKAKTFPLSKLFLILPFVTHSELLTYLAKQSTKIQSIEKLIVDKTVCFSNFNKRYYDALTLTVEAIEYLNDLEYIQIENGSVMLLKDFNYDKNMGKRAEKIHKTSTNIAKILKDRADILYLNLRIEL